MNTIEVTLFVAAVFSVICLGIFKSRPTVSSKASDSASGYFLAGRGLNWWLVGFSLIAANISTEQFVGMSGSAANWLGMAIASYEWMAAITLVFVGFFFLPKFLKCGLYTIPEFLEYRYNSFARLAMSIPAIVTMVFVTTSSVIFSGGKFVSEYYNTVPILNNLTVVCWLIAGFAALYVFVGGLRACAWTDLIWGASLILGGLVVLVMALNILQHKPAEELILTKVKNSTATVEDIAEANAIQRLVLLNDGKEGEAVAKEGPNGTGGKLHMVRPITDTDIPWTALMIGLWIPNFFYWGLNQYIVQRTLGSKSLAEGQKGIIFAAGLKLIIPFVVVIPGILAFNLYQGDLLNVTTGTYDYDRAFPVLVRNLVKPYPLISWFVLAALCGAVISSLASMLNSASTMATMDLYAKFSKQKDPSKLVFTGRIFVVLFVVLAAMVAPMLDNFTSIFSYIQEFQGFISPGFLGVFIFGFFSPKTPRYFGSLGIIASVVIYGALKWLIAPVIVENGWWFSSQMAFLDRMAVTFFLVLLIGLLITIFDPTKEPIVLPESNEIALKSSASAKLWGIAVVVVCVLLYIVFW